MLKGCMSCGAGGMDARQCLLRAFHGIKRCDTLGPYQLAERVLQLRLRTPVLQVLTLCWLPRQMQGVRPGGTGACLCHTGSPRQLASR